MPSKDQRTTDDNETASEKWDRAKSLFLESLYKPDHELRGCAHNQRCFYELMDVKEHVISIVRAMENPHHVEDTDRYKNIPARY